MAGRQRKQTPEEQRVADIEAKKNQLIEYARSTGDVDLALVAIGYKDPWEFLEKAIGNDAGKAKIGDSRETLKTRLSANQKRRKELERWLRTESLEPYRDCYARELELIEECQIHAVYDLLIDIDYLNERVQKEEAEAEREREEKGQEVDGSTSETDEVDVQKEPHDAPTC